MTRWFFGKNGHRHGPVSLEQIQQLVQTNELSPSDLVWREGMAEWSTAGQMPELFPPAAPAAATLAAPEPPPMNQVPSVPVAGAVPRPVEYASPRAAMPPGYVGLSVGSLLLGIGGLCISGFPLGIISILLARAAIKGMNRSGNLGSKPVAIIGMVLGCLDIFFAAAGLAYYVATAK